MQVGKISAYNLQKNFDEFYYEVTDQRWDFVTRVIHNQEQVIRCQLRDGTSTPNAIIKYWNMDGTEAAQFTVGSGGVPYTNILDMMWLTDDEKFVYIRQPVGESYYQIYRCSSDGASPTLLVDQFAPPEFAPWSTSSESSYVGITASESNLFVKVGESLYSIPESVYSSPPVDWSSISPSCTSTTGCFHYGDGSECTNLSYQPSVSGVDYILYSWYDSNIDVLYLRGIKSDDLSYDPTRWSMLDISDYSDINYPLFINQLDADSLHYLSVTSTLGNQVDTTPAYLQVFNIDEDLAAFLNVNSADTVMPAGIGATSPIIARVSNCWGTTLSGKLVQFWVSSGDGGVYPTYAYTDEDGRAQTTFTTGASAGVSTVSVVVNEI